ncbi:hypothetical protein ACJQWY_03910 [Weissella kandleri]|uniref:hypothetical protein n=1 Tax=Weissella kandleri TaxID=1616 RepID=UPI00387EDC3C
MQIIKDYGDFQIINLDTQDPRSAEPTSLPAGSSGLMVLPTSDGVDLEEMISWPATYLIWVAGDWGPLVDRLVSGQWHWALVHQVYRRSLIRVTGDLTTGQQLSAWWSAQGVPILKIGSRLMLHRQNVQVPTTKASQRQIINTHIPVDFPRNFNRL